MRFFSRFLPAGLPKRSASKPAPRSSMPLALLIEPLEDRVLLSTLLVVPLFSTTDNTHFHSLTAAESAAAASGDTIQIEPGATDSGTLVVTKSGTIQGDPNVPPDILPLYGISVTASNVVLRNLNLNSVFVQAGFHNVTITRVEVNIIAETSGPTGNGSNTITQNLIRSLIDLGGNTQSGTSTNDVVSNNVFVSTASILLNVRNSNGTIIQNNHITGADTANQVGMLIDNSAGLIIANNELRLTGATPTGIKVNNSVTPTAVTIRNNVINTNAAGTGLSFVVSVGSQFSAVFQGNDLHGNQVGLADRGDATSGSTALGNVDAGGGTLNGLGGNNFRGFSGQNGNFAIQLTNINAIATLATLVASNNIFTAGANLSALVQDQHNGGVGTASITALDANSAFVQTLYDDLLGRTGATSEISNWVTILKAAGQSTVVNAMLRSQEALGRVVDGLYLEYLGRQADAPGRAAWVSILQNGGTLEGVTSNFINSPEYLSHINTDFVQSLYLHILRRSGGPQELAFWYTRLPALGLNGVALQFLQSMEYRTRGVTSLYVDFLHRQPGSAQATMWVNAPLDLLSIEAAILSSGEFFTNG